MELPIWFEVLTQELCQGLVVCIMRSRFSLKARPHDRCIILWLLIVELVDVCHRCCILLPLIFYLCVTWLWDTLHNVNRQSWLVMRSWNIYTIRRHGLRTCLIGWNIVEQRVSIIRQDQSSCSIIRTMCQRVVSHHYSASVSTIR